MTTLSQLRAALSLIESDQPGRIAEMEQKKDVA